MNRTSFMELTRRIVLVVAAGLALYAVASGWSPERWLFGGGAGERELYVKLPLQQPQFHWYFHDEAALLSGSLEIEIHRADGEATTLTVFADGAMSPGWAPISRNGQGIYFGFTGGKGVQTERSDSLVVTLQVSEDLEGIGAYRTGILPAGRYRAVASYGRLTGHPDPGLLGDREPTAFVSCWRSTWPLEITEDAGWRGSVAVEQARQGWFMRMMAWADLPRGTDGARCIERAVGEME